MAKSSKGSRILKGITRLQLIITLYSQGAIREEEEAIAVGCRWIIRAMRCRGRLGRCQAAMSTRIGRGLRARLAGTGSSSTRGQKLVVKDSQAIRSRWASHPLAVLHSNSSSRCSVIKTRAITRSSMDMLHNNNNNNNNISIRPQAIKCFCRRSMRA